MINKQLLEKYITHPENLSLSTIPDMEKLVETFPYFQSAQLLYVKNLRKEHNIHYNQQLRIAAAYAGDRAMLKQLLEQDAEEPVAAGESNQTMKQSDAASELSADSLDKETSYQDAGIGNAEQMDSSTVFEKETKKEQRSDESQETRYSALSDHPSGSVADNQTTKFTESENQSENTPETPASRRKRELEQLKREMDELKKERQTIERVIREEEQRKMQRREKSAKKDIPESTDEESSKAESTEPASESKKPKARSSAVEKPVPNIGRYTKGSQRKSKQELIDRFIREEPSIKRTNTVFYDPTEAARKSILQSDDLATETLARIYLKQGKVLQAIKIYEKLSLKFPQKSDYFANQIKEIKKNQ